MLVSELPGEWRNSLLKQSPLWNREVSSLTTLDLSAFLRRHMGTIHHLTARKQVDTLIDACWAAVLEGSIAPAPAICYFSPPVVRLTYDELREWLSKTSPVRALAILFALETKRSIEEVIDLTWKDYNPQNVSTVASRLVGMVPRHFKLQYVFWESLPSGTATPLFGLQESVRDVTQGRGWEELKTLYSDLIPMDRDADAEAFRGDLGIDLADWMPTSQVRH